MSMVKYFALSNLFQIWDKIIRLFPNLNIFAKETVSSNIILKIVGLSWANNVGSI
jgi:hypothetical protein